MRNIKFRYKLFISMTILLSGIIFIASIFYYFYSIKNLTNTELQGSKTVLEGISNQINHLYSGMDTALNSLIYNPQLKNTLQILNSDDNNSSEIDSINRKRTIENNLESVLFFPNISNVLLYNSKKDYFYYSGYYLKDHEYIHKMLKKNDYLDKLKKENSTLMLPPHTNYWDPTISPVISVYKNFTGNTITRDTILEIQVPYRVLQEICNQESFKRNKEVLIFDNDFNLIYPYNNPLSIINQKILKELKYKLKNGEKSYMSNSYSYTSIHSNYTNFNLVLVSNNFYLLKEISKFTISTIVFALAILITTLSIVFFITNKLSKPLNTLVNHINEITLDKDTKLCIKDDNFDEFEVINDSFNTMLEKLKASIALAYEAKIEQANANFLALQAQINPHFLYNTLNAISAASEIYGSEVTTKMCQELSLMMRYVTSNKQEVKLIDEINHVINYLELMKVSNGESFNYKINIPLEAYDLIIPKLTIQPIVENCFKHGFKECMPPWYIEIDCTTTLKSFKISIKDNGSGFKESSINEFKEFSNKFTSYDYTNVYKDLKIGGLGLKNIYSRLAIFYNNKISFIIKNKDKGCEIIIERMNLID